MRKWMSGVSEKCIMQTETINKSQIESFDVKYSIIENKNLDLQQENVKGDEKDFWSGLEENIFEIT